MAELSLRSPTLSDMTWQAFSKGEKRLVAALLVAALPIFLLSFPRYGTSGAMFVGVCIALAAHIFIYALWFFRHHLTDSYGKGTANRLLLISISASIGIGLLLEFATLVGAPVSSPFNPANWGTKRIVVFAVLAFFAMPAIIKHAANIRELRKSNGLDALAKYYTIPLLLVSTIAISLAASIPLGLWNWSDRTPVTCFLFLLILIISGVALIFSLRDRICKHPEYPFFIIVILCGSFLSIALPPVTSISFDDQIHYDGSLGLSYLSQSEISKADVSYTQVPWIHDNVINYDEVDVAVKRNNELVEDASNYWSVQGFRGPASGTSLMRVFTFGYVPSAAGLWLGRLLGLGSSANLILGRWVNLIFYALVFAEAIRIVPKKKIVMAAIGMLPTAVFCASNYSYDPWVNCWLALGIAHVFREASDSSRKFSFGSWLSCFLPITLGLCPKAIYFPVIGLLFLIPKARFRTKRDYRLFNTAVFLFGLGTFATFFLPLVFNIGSGVAVGDTRGGDSVNSGAQIAYILNNPIAFVQMMGNFLLNYLSPVQSDMYTISYPFYIGHVLNVVPFLSTAPFTMLVITALFDGNSTTIIGPSIGKRVWIFFVFIFSIFLVATSLYISFTPVGLNTVNGCQARYILPVAFLGFMLIESKAIQCTQSARRVLLPMVILGVFSIINFATFVIWIR